MLKHTNMPCYGLLNRYFLVFAAVHLHAMGIVLAQDTTGVAERFFTSGEILSLTLTMDMKTVLKEVGDEMQQHPAVISYLSPEGDSVAIPIKIRPRGHFRKDPINCNFPPLRLNFSSQATPNTIFEGQDKLKLVSHCRSKRSQYEQNVLKEYLIYRLYNLFTEESFRVRLAEMNYVDSGGKVKTQTKMAFLIEPSGQMALRNHCEEIEVRNVRQGDCDREKTTRLSVFQYMIGNTDWSVPALHNVVLMQERPEDPPVLVPFDFDWCGLVNAPYAVPAEILDIENVRIRTYRGLCRTEEEFERVFQEFRDRETEIYNTIRSIPRLEEKNVTDIVRYIEQFFATINNPKRVDHEFYRGCRTE